MKSVHSLTADNKTEDYVVTESCLQVWT